MLCQNPTAAASSTDEETTQYDGIKESDMRESESNTTTTFQYDETLFSQERSTTKKRKRAHSPDPLARQGVKTRGGFNFSSGESVSERSFNDAYNHDEQTENDLLKTLLVQRGQTLNPLQNLFLSFADVVASFPETVQIEMKQKIFQIITDQELKLSLEQQNNAFATCHSIFN